MSFFLQMAPRASVKSKVSCGAAEDRYQVMVNDKKAYLFDKRFKSTDTPTKAYLKSLEDHLTDDKPTAYYLNARALNSTQVVSLLSRHDVHIPILFTNVDRIRRTLLKRKKRIEFKIQDNRDAFNDERNVFDIKIPPEYLGL